MSKKKHNNTSNLSILDDITAKVSINTANKLEIEANNLNLSKDDFVDIILFRFQNFVIKIAEEFEITKEEIDDLYNQVWEEHNPHVDGKIIHTTDIIQ